MKPVKSILFATNLSKSCIPAFEFAASMAIRYQATLVLLHVMEKMPDYVEGRLRGLLGENKYKELEAAHEKEARQTLIGKKSTSKLIRAALDRFCVETGIDDNACDYHSREIVLGSGEVIEEILAQAEKHQCELIVMGARQGFIKDNAIGKTIKSILRRSRIAVMVVPPYADEEADNG